MVVKNSADRPVGRSHLFMLRLWPEDLGGGQTDWRGSVQHVNSGEVRYSQLADPGGLCGRNAGQDRAGRARRR